jgi:glycerol uptake facilitator-like aquaporin
VFGIVLGASVFLGVTVAVLIGSLGGLNPAVALALGLVNPTYLVAPVIGAVIGFNLYRITLR